MKRSISRLLLLWVVGLVVSGCASMQPLSNYARSGDTVAISLGGTHSNALTAIVKKENVAVNITDSAGNTYAVKVRNVFRLYSDPTSIYDFRNLIAQSGYTENYTPPHQGLWMAILDLVDPFTDQPLPLATGAATLSVNSADIQNWFDPTTWGWTWTNGNLDAVPIEILAGTGSPSPLNYLQPMTDAPVDKLEPSSQLQVDVQGTPAAKIGGAQFVFQFTNNSFGKFPRVTVTTPDRNVQLGWNRQDQGDGTSLLSVTLSNPHGFNVDNSRNGVTYFLGQGGGSLLRSLSFNIYWDDSVIDDSNWQSHIQLVSDDYVDLNGQPMAGLTTSVQKVR